MENGANCGKHVPQLWSGLMVKYIQQVIFHCCGGDFGGSYWSFVICDCV